MQRRMSEVHPATQRERSDKRRERCKPRCEADEKMAYPARTREEVVGETAMFQPGHQQAGRKNRHYRDRLDSQFAEWPEAALRKIRIERQSHRVEKRGDNKIERDEQQRRPARTQAVFANERPGEVVFVSGMPFGPMRFDRSRADCR